MRRLTMVAMVLGGCASASTDPGGVESDSGTPGEDAGTDGTIVIDGAIDAIPIDAAPMPITVTQSASQAMVAGNTIVCGQSPYTVENHFYRVFQLSDHGITGAYQVQNVQFGVEQSQGGHTVTVNVGTYAGAIAPNSAGLDPAQWAPIATTSVAIPDGAGLTIVAPIALTIPAGSKMMVEILSPSSGDRFFPASNPSGQTYPTYRRTPCNNDTIQSYASLGFPDVHLVMSVTGLH